MRILARIRDWLRGYFKRRAGIKFWLKIGNEGDLALMASGQVGGETVQDTRVLAINRETGQLELPLNSVQLDGLYYLNGRLVVNAARSPTGTERPSSRSPTSPTGRAPGG